MKVIIIGGGNGMLSNSIGTFLKKSGHSVQVIGKTLPIEYRPEKFIKKDFLEDEIYITELLDSDVIIYAAGAGVQATIPVEAATIYTMNLQIPIKLCLLLNKYGYQGAFVSFGSYMEIGNNSELYKLFTEKDLVHSCYCVTNDYSLSKRLFTRYIYDANFNFRNYHFILPNLFSKDETGMRLLPYVINYLKEIKRGGKIIKPRLSSGYQIRQYVYIEEVMEAVFKCIEGKVTSGIYNIGGGQIATIKEFVAELFEAFTVDLDEKMFGKEIRRDNDIQSLSLDNTKLWNTINYSPTTKVTDIYHG